MMIRIFNSITILLALGMQMFCSESVFKPTDIAEMIRGNDTTGVARWLKKGGDPNLAIQGESLLYIATGPYGGYEVTAQLVNAGADINKGMGKYTPLMNAASWVSYNTVKFLLEKGADPNLKNNSGETALATTGSCNNCEDEIKIKSLLTPLIKTDSE